MGLAEIVYSHTWYNIRERKNSVEIYAPDNYSKQLNSVFSLDITRKYGM